MFGRGDAADADQRDGSTGGCAEVANTLECEAAQGCAAKASCLAGVMRLVPWAVEAAESVVTDVTILERVCDSVAWLEAVIVQS